MTRVKIRHYVVKRQKGFWQPTQKMRLAGFKSIPLGADCPQAWAKAEEWNDRWDRVTRGQEPSPAAVDFANLTPERAEELVMYPAGSMGEAFKRYRKTVEFARKAPRTREEWWRAWRRIRTVFGDCDPRTVSLEHISDWRKAIEETVSLREAHRCLKIWRAFWKVMAAMQYCERDADPSLGVRNTAASARDASWVDGEATRLCKQAWRMGFKGLAAVMAVSWSTQLSPGDVRALTIGQLRLSAKNGEAFFTQRAKTKKPVGGMLTDRALYVLRAYIAELPFELHDDAPIFRNRSGHAYSKDTLGDDFRAVRIQTFGERDKRTLADFRRSGALEAFAGGATAPEVSHAMGNTLSASNALYAIYAPPNVTSIRAVLEARRLGRTKQRGT